MITMREWIGLVGVVLCMVMNVWVVMGRRNE